MDKSNNVGFETTLKNIPTPAFYIFHRMLRSNYDGWNISLVSTLYTQGPVENAERGCSAGFLINGIWKGVGQIPSESLESSTSFDVFTFLTYF